MASLANHALFAKEKEHTVTHANVNMIGSRHSFLLRVLYWLLLLGICLA